ncbi:beta-propeller domain-containing protein [Saccharothrix lopnurensis]|uniref:Beta-propeller domain-containing protein n=1 Tax=Saccharothrix lopnurensis TaxID=1670621 RepID=A0ABW1P0Q3_9PSEU
MTRKSWGGRAALLAGAALVAGVSAASAVPGAQGGPPVEAVPVDLVAFDTCDTALAGLRRAIAPHVGAYGLGGGYFAAQDGGVAADARAGASPPVAAQQGATRREAAAVPDAVPREPGAPGHSSTNAHEAGVDEPDLVKTDGERVVTVADGRLRVVDAADRRVTATLDLPGGHASQLLLHGDRALVVGSPAMAMPGWGVTDLPATDPVGQGSSITLVDLAGQARVLGSLTVTGRFVDARQTGDVVRVVTHSAPRLGWVYPTDGGEVARSLIRNREIAATAPIEAWLPRYELTGADGARTEGPLVACDRLSHPVEHPATSVLSVLTFDFPGELGSGDAVAITADGDTVYGTGASLYVADDHRLRPSARGAATAFPTTAIHQFDTSRPGPPEHVASGEVPGALLNQYALSEHDGHLRVATTTSEPGPVARNSAPREVATQSSVTVLRRAGKAFEQVGKLDGLGVGEQIYSVRFAGPVGYVVTFRQVDPLYTLDLSDPADPRRVGELKITGYSAYLHPAGDGRLIGVGQEATARGRTTGTQVSLFDVSDPAAPAKVAGHHLPGAYSEVEFDPHAFLFWDDLVVLPVVDERTSGLLVLRLDGAGFSPLGTVRHGGADVDPGPRRALVIGEELWTVSAAGAGVHGLADLGQRAWVPFT